mmetsp:Transcript_46073/g.147367  ORF Transcript_46073/g.147367 Transcript_46073/m.147367 type:complete len:424 (-) Transcript_46073:2734-4005(-)
MDHLVALALVLDGVDVVLGARVTACEPDVLRAVLEVADVHGNLLVVKAVRDGVRVGGHELERRVEMTGDVIEVARVEVQLEANVLPAVCHRKRLDRLPAGGREQPAEHGIGAPVSGGIIALDRATPPAPHGLLDEVVIDKLARAHGALDMVAVFELPLDELHEQLELVLAIHAPALDADEEAARVHVPLVHRHRIHAIGRGGVLVLGDAIRVDGVLVQLQLESAGVGDGREVLELDDEVVAPVGISHVEVEVAVPARLALARVHVPVLDLLDAGADRRVRRLGLVLGFLAPRAVPGDELDLVLGALVASLDAEVVFAHLHVAHIQIHVRDAGVVVLDAHLILRRPGEGRHELHWRMEVAGDVVDVARVHPQTECAVPVSWHVALIHHGIPRCTLGAVTRFRGALVGRRCSGASEPAPVRVGAM